MCLIGNFPKPAFQLSYLLNSLFHSLHNYFFSHVQLIEPQWMPSRSHCLKVCVIIPIWEIVVARPSLWRLAFSAHFWPSSAPVQNGSNTCALFGLVCVSVPPAFRCWPCIGCVVESGWGSVQQVSPHSLSFHFRSVLLNLIKAEMPKQFWSYSASQQHCSSCTTW